VVGAILAAFLTQGLHRHVQHDEGLYRPHVDCLVCAWSVNAHSPALGGGADRLSGPAVSRSSALPPPPAGAGAALLAPSSRAPPAA
jgi:hypothetical protein